MEEMLHTQRIRVFDAPPSSVFTDALMRSEKGPVGRFSCGLTEHSIFQIHHFSATTSSSKRGAFSGDFHDVEKEEGVDAMAQRQGKVESANLRVDDMVRYSMITAYTYLYKEVK